MSTPTTLAPCTPLPFDTDFFGVQIGRGTLPVQAAHQCAKDLGLDCLYLLIPIEEMGEAHEAVWLGFRLVDVRVQFEIKPRPGRSSTRLAQPSDLPRLAEIARASFHSTRFYNDPHFKRESCDALYETWTKNAYVNDTVLVAVRDEQVDGYVTLTEEGAIGLIAVAAASRRQGVGSSLLRGALDWAYVQRLESLTVVTQGGNTAAQRLFQSAGFRSQSVGLWFHLWIDR